MAENSRIAWTDDTVNAWIGCNEVRLVLPSVNGEPSVHVASECDACYAKTQAFNRMGYNGSREDYPVLWGNPKTTPRHRTKYVANLLPKLQGLAVAGGRRLVFAFSMSDWAEEHPDVGPWRDEFLADAGRCNMLDFLLLTKRPQNALRMVPESWIQRWPQNIWLGLSAGTQAAMDRRKGYLYEWRATGVPVAFISMEPLLEVVDPSSAVALGANWIISGGESGHGEPGGRARIDVDVAAYRLVRDVAASQGVAYFHKQGSGPRSGMHPELDGRLHHEWPTVPGVQGPLGGVRLSD